jgi:hypothetical protein
MLSKLKNYNQKSEELQETWRAGWMDGWMDGYTKKT